MESKRIEFHILQSFPVSCLNRDDVGSPKTAIVGGTTRARVSSQCWKRYVRLGLRNEGITLGHRTKLVASFLTAACSAAGANKEQATACGKAMANILTKKTLLFIGNHEADAFAQFAKNKDFNPAAISGKELVKASKAVLNKNLDALDIALFGRMVAKCKELQVEAACSFSHAISTHRASTEYDPFTALDDNPDTKAAAHLDVLEFNSATYYRYISLDVASLQKNLSSGDVALAVKAFTYSLFDQVPRARQTTMAAACSWDYARVLVRTGQPLQLSFDEPVKSTGEGFLKPSIKALDEQLQRKEKLAGSRFGKIKDLKFGVHEDYSIDRLVEDLIATIEA
ncbi:CRISPR system Cascade subunit CasC [Pseudomonas sp. IT-194MI4]|uniref:type I-E CRISPR-associated protein Cas7/Cse4/CasC n=1 Tax=Pseudomonas sp. IT-194MI4 TaxID=3026443 RepID=UPI0039E0F3ED